LIPGSEPALNQGEEVIAVHGYIQVGTTFLRASSVTTKTQAATPGFECRTEQQIHF